MKSLPFSWRYVAIMLGTIVSDRLSKWYMITAKPLPITHCLTLAPGINRGLSWGIFDSNELSIFLLVSLCAAAFFLFFSCYTWHRYCRGFFIDGELLIIAGALSNLVDRVIYGGVVDFIIISCGSWAWPSFNIADAAITLGALIIFWQVFKGQS